MFFKTLSSELIIKTMQTRFLEKFVQEPDKSDEFDFMAFAVDFLHVLSKFS